MNRILAFALVVAMIVAAILGVRLQQAGHDAETEIRRMERELTNQVAPVRIDTKATQEIRRLEGELQALRLQLAGQRETAGEVLRAQVTLLRQENATLQMIISNQLRLAANVVKDTSVTKEAAVVETVPDEIEEDPGIGMGVVGMNEFRLMNWRRGTLPTEGAAVIELLPGGTAGAAGLQPGDIITSLDGEPVDSAEMLDEKLSAMVPGRVTTLVVDRDRVEVVVSLLIPLENPAE